MEPIQRSDRGSDLFWRIPVIIRNRPLIRVIIQVHATNSHPDGHVDLSLSCFEDTPEGDKPVAAGL